MAVLGFALLTIGLEWEYVLVRLDPAPHAAVLDSLAIPGSWDLVHTEIVKDLLFGSRVTRFYVVDADPDEVVEPVTRILAAAGFTVEVRYYASDWCTYTRVGDTSPPPGSFGSVCPDRPLEPCWTNGPGGPMTCNLTATRGQDRLSILALDRGRNATYYTGLEGHVIGVPGRIVVLVTVDY